LVFGIELLATAMLMGVIYLVVYTNGLRRLGGIAIGGMVSLDIFFLAFISGASMNPTRSLAPALFSGIFDNLGSIGLQLLLEVLQSPVSFAESSRKPRENS
jgi:aquaporin Z